jgi:hypothetical protein
MCRRSNPDPLVRLFLDKYRMNLLSVPREKANVGDVYVESGGQMSAPGNVANLFTGKFKLPAVTKNERLAALAAERSAEIEVSVGLKLLQGFLAALGAAASIGDVGASYQRANARTVRFRISDATREAVDSTAFGKSLIDQELDEKHPFVAPKNRYFVTTAVIRAKQIALFAQDDMKQAVDVGLDAAALKLLETKAGVKLTRHTQGEATWEGPRALALAVELVELVWNEKKGKFFAKFPEGVGQVRADGEAPAVGTFIGDEIQGEAFVDLP